MALGQTGDAVLMKWKLKPGETIKYKTFIDEKDSAGSQKISMPFPGKLFGDSTRADSITNMMAEFFKQMSKVTDHMGYITTLSETKKDLIDVEMAMVDSGVKDIVVDTIKLGEAAKGIGAMMSKMRGGVTLRGSIHEDGTIASFYTKGGQRNLLAGFFELPGRPVRIGDSWSIDIHYISMDQSFKCDSSFRKNNVVVSRIDKKNGDEIVTLQYDIDEFVTGDLVAPFGNGPIKTTMKMTYKAIAEFSIGKGRWLSYDGVMTEASTGLMDSRVKKQCKLIAE